MKTAKDVKARFVAGLEIEAQHHSIHTATGRRVIEKVQTNGYWYIQLAVGQPPPGSKLAERTGRRCWYKFPKADLIRIDGPDLVTFLDSPGVPLVTLNFRPDSPEEHEIAHVLVVTTGHLKQAERDRLFGLDGEAGSANLVGEYGGMVYVNPKPDAALLAEEAELSDGYQGCLKIARAQKCGYILFDADGSYYTHLPDYEAIADAEVMAARKRATNA